MSSVRVMVIEDEIPMLENYTRMVKGMGYECVPYSDSVKAIKDIKKQRPDVIIADLKMPGMDGFELLEFIKSNMPDVPVLLITAYASISTAVEAVKKGAFDFIPKPFTLTQLRVSIQKAIRHRNMLEENRRLKELLRLFGPEKIVFRSYRMIEVVDLAKTVAPTDANILITGESGTGKELLARTIHRMSARRDGPFIVVDCTAIPEGLLESELFGYEKGAFTGAVSAKAGLLEEAEGGTLFLDEVGELPLTLQVKLLRVIQERTLRRLGGQKTRHIDIRWIAATNRNLREAVKNGKFREDLFYRLNVVNINIPPLRERVEDIPLLANTFLNLFSSAYNKEIETIAPDAMAYLESYKWPGNVRELKNVIERAVILSRRNTLTVDLLPPEIRSNLHGRPVITEGLLPYREAKERIITSFEKEYFEKLLSKTGGNISRAAELAGINRRTIHRLLKKLSIDRTSMSQRDINSTY